MSLARQSKDSLANRRRADRRFSDAIERRIGRVESVLIGLTIAAAAYGDWLSGRDVSLGFLYLIPLSYSALTQPRGVTFALVALCVGLRQWISPIEESPRAFFVRDWILTAIFAAVAGTLWRFGTQRRLFFEEARAQRDELFQEVEMAAEVQEQIIRRNGPPPTRLDMHAQMRPARVIGGDYYDFVPAGEDEIAAVVADVAGKGLAAAMLMPAADIALQSLTARLRDPGEILVELNRLLYENTGHNNYATVFMAVLHPETGRLRYANGGHPPGLLLRADGSIDWLTAGGTPIGLLPAARFETAETRLGPGELLVLYSDGVIEAENDAGEPFGAERVAALARERLGERAAAIVEALLEASAAFAADENAADDATVIVVKAPRDG